MTTHADEYRESMKGCDLAAVALHYKMAGCKLAEACNFPITNWDGHHRLALAVSEWYKAVADERRVKPTYREEHEKAYENNKGHNTNEL